MKIERLVDRLMLAWSRRKCPGCGRVIDRRAAVARRFCSADCADTVQRDTAW